MGPIDFKMFSGQATCPSLHIGTRRPQHSEQRATLRREVGPKSIQEASSEVASVCRHDGGTLDPSIHSGIREGW